LLVNVTKKASHGFATLCNIQLQIAAAGVQNMLPVMFSCKRNFFHRILCKVSGMSWVLGYVPRFSQDMVI